jgi:glucose/arabinose dehydrogenase
VAFRSKLPLALAGTLAGLTLVALSPAALAAVVKPDADTKPPTSPTNNHVTATTESTVALAWNAATDNVGVTQYAVFKQGQEVMRVDGKTLKATVTKLTPDSDFVFTIVARDAAGNSSQDSNEAKAHTKASSDKTPPSVPTGLKSTSNAGGNVGLSWNASKDNTGGVGGVTYLVFQDGKQVATPDTNSVTVGNLTGGTTYTFTVKAVDAVGNTSAASAGLKVTANGGGGGGGTPGKVTTVTTDKDIPWGLAFLPDGSGIYTRRDADDVIKVTASGQKTTLGKISGVSGTDGEGGLLGIELDPAFNSNHFVYIYYTTSSDNRVGRFTLNGNTISSTPNKVLISGIQRNKFHNGGRLRFGPDGKLYISTGDAENGNNAQNTNSLNGKVLRINPDGSIPADNPFHNAVWSYGHRNVQGLAFDSQGRLWEAELGNSYKDELNLIQKGKNYGWPKCEADKGSCDGFVAPVQSWPVAQASPSGLAIVHNTLYMAALRGEQLWVMTIQGNSTSKPKAFFQGQFGRMRTVEPSPDGDIWVTTSSGDKDSTPNNSNDKVLHVALN